jgi:hypothetical protein
MTIGLKSSYPNLQIKENYKGYATTEHKSRAVASHGLYAGGVHAKPSKVMENIY